MTENNDLKKEKYPIVEIIILVLICVIMALGMVASNFAQFPEPGITWEKTKYNQGETVELSVENVYDRNPFTVKFSNLDSNSTYFLYFVTDQGTTELCNFTNMTGRISTLEGKSGKYILARYFGHTWCVPEIAAVIVIEVNPEVPCGRC